MSIFCEILEIFLLAMAIATLIVCFLLLLRSLRLDFGIAKNMKLVSKERKHEEYFNQKTAEELVKLKNDADAQVCSERKDGNNPHLVIAFYIIDKDRKPIIKDGHNTVEMELAEDRIDSLDHYAVLCEPIKAIDRMRVCQK